MLLLLSLLLCSMADSARILGVFPMPSVSHQVVFRALTMELAKRGHELVIITPDPALPTNRPKDNITEISTKKTYDLVMKMFLNNSKSVMKRGAISDMDMMTSFEILQAMLDMTTEFLNVEEVNALLNDKTQKFDLVIAEAFATYYYYIFAKIYNAPLITFASFTGLPEIFEVAGAVSRHPVFYPNLMRNKFKNLSFFEKISEYYNEYKVMRSYARLGEYENEFLKNKFGENAPTVDELKDLVSMVFLNAFHVFDNNRPVPPNVVYLGALHMQPVKELPKINVAGSRWMQAAFNRLVWKSLGEAMFTSGRPMADDEVNMKLDQTQEAIKADDNILVYIVAIVEISLEIINNYEQELLDFFYRKCYTLNDVGEQFNTF